MERPQRNLVVLKLSIPIDYPNPFIHGPHELDRRGKAHIGRFFLYMETCNKRSVVGHFIHAHMILLQGKQW